MRNFTKLSLAVATAGALVLGSSMALAGPHHWGWSDDGYDRAEWCGGPGWCGDGPRGPRGYGPDHRGFGPRGHHMGYYGGGWGHHYNHGFCTRHDMPMADCIGSEAYNQFKADFERIEKLQDQVFVQRKVLESDVNAGASSTAANAEKFVAVRDELRQARYELRQKLYDYYQKQGDK